MQKIALFFIALAIVVSGIFLVPPALAADTKHAIQCGVNNAAGIDNCASPSNTGTGGLNTTIRKVVNILSIIVGIVAVIMIIIGGFRYVTSAGDSTRTAAAKNTIIYALIGLIIVALAQVISRFVLKQVT